MSQAGDFPPRRKLPKMAAGQRYGRLVAVELVERDVYRNARWRFVCDCGRGHVTWAHVVRTGQAMSCGCLKSQRAVANTHRKSHGMSKSPEYRNWDRMMDRCNNPNNIGYSGYGGRGIKVCARWRKFENFFADMGPRPSPKHSLDRYPDNDGNYEPGNVRWATADEQKHSQIILIILNGKTVSIAEAAKLLGVSYGVAYRRYRAGHFSLAD